MQSTLGRSGVRELADLLIVEYAGALPPGQVLALVVRAERSLARLPELPAQTRLLMCEALVRRLIADRVVALGRPPITTRRHRT